jgi:hypothetical protein
MRRTPLRSRKVWNVTYSSGMTKMPTALAAIIPVKTFDIHGVSIGGADLATVVNESAA